MGGVERMAFSDSKDKALSDTLDSTLIADLGSTI